jgi:hypothetical protein
MHLIFEAIRYFNYMVTLLIYLNFNLLACIAFPIFKVCVCVCVCVCARALCVCVCVRACVRACEA